jgi:hypothetical protein
MVGKISYTTTCRGWLGLVSRSDLHLEYQAFLSLLELWLESTPDGIFFTNFIRTATPPVCDLALALFYWKLENTPSDVV